MSADEVREQIGRRHIGQATVYRVLKAATEAGAILAVELPHGPTRYEPADRPHHHHFACDDCGSVFDVPGCPGGMDRLVPAGFEMDRHEVLLFGRCADCAERGAA